METAATRCRTWQLGSTGMLGRDLPNQVVPVLPVLVDPKQQIAADLDLMAS